MRYSKLLAWTLLLAGVMVTGAQAKAEERGGRYDIAADRYRLAEAIRCGHYGEAAAIRRDIARDEAALRYHRDFRFDHDRR